MKRHVAVLYLLLCCRSLLAQTPAADSIVWEGIVLDAQSARPIPFATIATATHRTLTNAEGAFTLVAAATDTALVRLVGYKSQHIPLRHHPAVVHLHPGDYVVEPVNILPLPAILHRLARQAYKEARQARKQKTNYFYRQTAAAADTVFEILEAFFSAHSALSLRQASLVTGRMINATAPDDTTHYSYRNLYVATLLTPLIHDYAKSSLRAPLVVRHQPADYYGNVYRTAYDILRDEAGQTIYEITFDAGPDPTGSRRSAALPLLTGTLYVDASTFHILRFSGRLDNISARTVRHNGTSITYPTSVTFDIHYTHQRGFTEVDVMSISTASAPDGHPHSYAATLFNVGHHYFMGHEKIDGTADLRRAVLTRRYDAGFWNQNPIVRRTLAEEQALRIAMQQE